MYINDRNIYKTARNTAGVTQEKAAEMLAISVESIRAYETGTRRPPDTIVNDMCIAYNSQLLGLQHLRQSGEWAGDAIPDVREVPLPEAAMELINHIYGFVDKHRDRDLIRIARDGIIDELERPELDGIVAELQNLAQAAIQLRYAKARDHTNGT